MKAVSSIDVGFLNRDEIAYLEKLGLSDHEVRVYQLIHSDNRAYTAQMVASKVMIFPNAVYRIFNELEKKGLIYQMVDRPKAYKAYKLPDAYKAAYSIEIQNLKKLLGAAVGDDPAISELTIITGRNEVYQEYMKLASDASKEIAVFAIGIAYSEELYKTQTDAIKRGVYIRHVVQQKTTSNYHVIHKWQRAGVNVRYFKEERGLHIVVIDQEVALITFSDPNDTEQRLSFLTRNPLAVKLFQAQFESIWHSAQKIDKK